MANAKDAVVGFIVPEPKPAAASIRGAALLALGLIALDLVLSEESTRLVALRAVLILMAAGEVAGAVGQGYRARSSSSRASHFSSRLWGSASSTRSAVSPSSL